MALKVNLPQPVQNRVKESGLRLPNSDLVDYRLQLGNCHTRPKVKTKDRNKKVTVSKAEPSELEVMFKKIKDRKRVIKRDKMSHIDLTQDTDGKKASYTDGKKVSYQNSKSVSESPSINKLMKTNQKDSPIRKKSSSRVRKIVMELETPLNPKSNNESSGVVKTRKSSFLHNQAKITRFFERHED